jgi:hypothetical protein
VQEIQRGVAAAIAMAGYFLRMQMRLNAIDQSYRIAPSPTSMASGFFSSGSCAAERWALEFMATLLLLLGTVSPFSGGDCIEWGALVPPRRPFDSYSDFGRMAKTAAPQAFLASIAISFQSRECN